MKQCPTCNRTYTDNTLSFCLDDGTPLITSYDPEATHVINPRRSESSMPPSAPRRANLAVYVVIALLALLIGGGLVALLKSGTRNDQVSATPRSQPSVTTNTSSISPRKQPTPVSEIEVKPTGTRVPDRTINYPATRTGWYPIGSGKFTLEVSGEINIGGNVIVTPEGWSKLGDNTAFVPGLPFGGLIAKIGGGTPFLVGYKADFDTQEQVYIAINDSTYSDNTGSFTVQIVGR